jgi:hypothetical protein
VRTHLSTRLFSLKRTEYYAALLCISVGVLMSSLPHFVAWWKTGDFAWIADNDEIYYLAVASQAYFNHPAKLTDPVRAGEGPSLYKPLPLLPGILASRTLQLGPLGIAFVWRVSAGAIMGLAWYILLRRQLGRTWISVACAIILLTDGGLIGGQLLFRQAINFSKIMAGLGDSLLAAKPPFHPEWRICTPALTMAYLIVMIWAVSEARNAPSRLRIVLAGLTFGCLFYVYFYYWTAAGLAMLIAMALDSGHRRTYFQIGLIGGVVGLPSVVSDFLMKQSTTADWLPRTDKFIQIGRFEELLIPKSIVLILVVALIWTIVRRRDLSFVWALSASGILLANHQVVTRLQIENFHWCYVWGPATSLFLVLATAGELAKSEFAWSLRRRISFVMITMFIICTGFWLRGIEASRAREATDNAVALAEYSHQRLSSRSRPLVPNAVVAGDAKFVDLATIVDNLRPLSSYCVTLSPTVTDLEWDERIALNSILCNVNRDLFASEQHVQLKASHWGPWSRDPILLNVRVRARIVAYDRARADLGATISKYHVRYVALPPGNRPEYITSDWSLLESGPTWNLWENEAKGHK